METILNIFPNAEGGRRFVVACYQRLDISGPTASRVDKPLPSAWLDGLLKQVVLTPEKHDIDVVLAKLPAEEQTRVWLQDGVAEPRPISEALLGPSASARFRTLADHAARQWAIAGGLCAVEALWEGASWQPRVCDIPSSVPVGYFNVAPVEQRFARLSEALTVWLDSSAGRTCSQLRLRPIAAWLASSGPASPIEVRLDTIVLDADGHEAIVFWRGSFSHAVEAGPPTVIAESVVAPAVEDEDTSAPEAAPMTQLAPIPTAEIVIGPTDFRRTMQSAVTAGDAALPFRSSPVAVAVPPPVIATSPESRWEVEDHETQSEEPEGLRAVLPFQSRGTQVSAPQTPRLSPVAPPVVAGLSPSLPRASYQIESDKQRLAFQRPLEAPTPALEPMASPTAVAPPTIVEMPPLESDPEPATQPKAMPEVTLEIVAMVDAELHMGVTGDRSSLAGHGISHSDIAAHQSRWADAIAADSKQGRRDLQRRYDVAYLDRLEALRERPVTPQEYARIVVSVERLNAAAVLAELGLPERSLLVLTRVFAERTAGSAELRREVRARVQEARRAEG